MIGPTGLKSNAALSKDAQDASAKANEASENAGDGDGPSHNRAGSAHSSAAWKNRDAGNETAAQFHEKAAKLHYEKGEAAQRATYYAQGEGRAAEDLSKKANMSAFGKDENELRNEKQLHTDAAAAHDKASKAFKMAGMKRESDYHGAMAKHHGAKGATSAVDEMAGAG